MDDLTGEEADEEVGEVEDDQVDDDGSYSLSTSTLNVDEKEDECKIATNTQTTLPPSSSFSSSSSSSPKKDNKVRIYYVFLLFLSCLLFVVK